MSRDLIKRVWELELAPYQGDVLEKLAWFADDDGENAFPGVARLAWILRRSERAIQYSLRELREAGLIEVTHNPGGGRGQRRGYRLRLDKGEARGAFSAIIKGEARGALPGAKGEAGDTKGETGGIKGEAGGIKGEAGGTAHKEGRPDTTSKDQGAAKPPWDPPTWFAPLMALDGYQRRNHSKVARNIQAACAAAAVAPGDVVREFVEYWPVGKVRHTWGSPTGALDRTIMIQISKTKGLNGRRPTSRGVAPTHADYEAEAARLGRRRQQSEEGTPG